MTRIFGSPATFEVVQLGDTPQSGFEIRHSFGRKFVGPSDGEPFDAFQLTCFDMAVRDVLDA